MDSRSFHTHCWGAALVAAALSWGGCASPSVKSTWRSPDYKGGPAQKVAVVAVHDLREVRVGMENRFSNQFAQRGQPAITTHQTMGLQQIKADKQAAAATFRQAGADTILIVRLVDSSTRFSETRQSHEAFVPVTQGFGAAEWHDWYSVAFTDLSTVRGSTRQDLLLDTTLFSLTTGKPIWSCLSKTMLKDDVDRLALADAFVATVVAALQKDGLVR